MYIYKQIEKSHIWYIYIYIYLTNIFLIKTFFVHLLKQETKKKKKKKPNS